VLVRGSRPGVLVAWLKRQGLLAQYDGQILHGRNQDYSILGLPNITVDVQFRRNKVPIFTGTTFASALGAARAVLSLGWGGVRGTRPCLFCSHLDGVALQPILGSLPSCATVDGPSPSTPGKATRL
jgi:hypothetical protein